MTSPQQKSRDPQPTSRGGEVALLALAGVLVLLALAALLGLGAAAAVFGGGWLWPNSSATAGRLLGGLLAGRPGRGLPSDLVGRLPGPVVVYSAVAAAELAMLTLAGAGGVLFWRWHRPGDARRGMATRAEAAQVLGRGRLRQAAAIIRPDLHGPAGQGIR